MEFKSVSVDPDFIRKTIFAPQVEPVTPLVQPEVSNLANLYLLATSGTPVSA
ncbi:MAG: hypothetical protein ACYCPP_04415 [Nitrososphaerales archaeon]